MKQLDDGYQGGALEESVARPTAQAGADIGQPCTALFATDYQLFGGLGIRLRPHMLTLLRTLLDS